jgi:hypothetical protein
MTTPNLSMPEIAGSQAQKHVTHNEALAVLDAVVQLSARTRKLTSPPGAPGQGVRWIVGSGATGAWAGKGKQIASWLDGGWTFYQPETGWTCFVEDEGLLTYVDDNWRTVLALSANGARTGHVVDEEEITVAGAHEDTTIVIPDRAILLAVSVRTTLAITGATSFDCGVVGETNKFGGSLGIALDSTNIGVIGPTAYYADTSIRLTANGSNFTGGKVRVAVHYLSFAAPAS